MIGWANSVFIFPGVRTRGHRGGGARSDRRRVHGCCSRAARLCAPVAACAAGGRGARRVIPAVPVAPEDIVAAMHGVADEVVVVGTPPWILSIGEFYEDFAQTSDEEVVSLLERAAARPERIAVVPGRG